MKAKELFVNKLVDFVNVEMKYKLVLAVFSYKLF